MFFFLGRLFYHCVWIRFSNLNVSYRYGLFVNVLPKCDQSNLRRVLSSFIVLLLYFFIVSRVFFISVRNEPFSNKLNVCVYIYRESFIKRWQFCFKNEWMNESHSLNETLLFGLFYFTLVNVMYVKMRSITKTMMKEKKTHRMLYLYLIISTFAFLSHVLSHWSESSQLVSFRFSIHELSEMRGT